MFGLKSRRRNAENTDDHTVVVTDQWRKAAWQLTSLTQDEFLATYDATFDLVLPMLTAASERSEKSPEQMTLDTKKLCIAALQVRRAHIIPQGSAPEDAKRIEEAVSYALVVCVFLSQLMPAWLASDQVIDRQTVYPFEHERLTAGQGVLREREPAIDSTGALLFVSSIIPKAAMTWLWSEPAALNEIVKFFARPETSQLAAILRMAQARVASSAVAPPVPANDREKPASDRSPKRSSPTENPQPVSKPVAQDASGTNTKNRPGHAYLRWLRAQLADKHLAANTEQSGVHLLLDGTVFLQRPEAFKHYAAHKELEVKTVENQVTRTGVLRSRSNGTNWFNVTLPDGQTQSGYVLKDASDLFPKVRPQVSQIVQEVH